MTSKTKKKPAPKKHKTAAKKKPAPRGHTKSKPAIKKKETLKRRVVTRALTGARPEPIDPNANKRFFPLTAPEGSTYVGLSESTEELREFTNATKDTPKQLSALTSRTVDTFRDVSVWQQAGADVDAALTVISEAQEMTGGVHAASALWDDAPGRIYTLDLEIRGITPPSDHPLQTRNPVDIEDWRTVIEYWLAKGHNLEHIEIPDDIAAQLGYVLTVKTSISTTDNTETSDDVPAAEDVAQQTSPPKDKNMLAWKRKAYFDGTECGVKGCDKSAVAYAQGQKPTKGGAAGAVWFGPVCQEHATQMSQTATVAPLMQLCQSAGSLSAAALVLDVEVGEVIKRLAALGLNPDLTANGQGAQGAQDLRGEPSAESVLPTTDARGQPYALSLAAQAFTVAPPGQALDTIVVNATVAIPTYVGDGLTLAKQGLQTWAGVQIRDQQTMQYAQSVLARVKGWWKNLDELRLELARPLREKIDEIQSRFKPPMAELQKLEAVIKGAMLEGDAWAKALAATSMQQAQSALHAGNMPAVAAATMQATQADLHLPRGVSKRITITWNVTDINLLPNELKKVVPDDTKIQFAIDLGHRNIPGVTLLEAETLAARSA